MRRRVFPVKKPRWIPTVRLRFTIRSLLLVTLLASLLLAWLGKHVVRATGHRPIVAQITASGGLVVYDYQLHPDHGFANLSRPPKGTWIVRWLLGDDIFATVRAVQLNDPRTTNADISSYR
jgi:hypothetical protein